MLILDLRFTLVKLISDAILMAFQVVWIIGLGPKRILISKLTSTKTCSRFVLKRKIANLLQSGASLTNIHGFQAEWILFFGIATSSKKFHTKKFLMS